MPPRPRRRPSSDEEGDESEVLLRWEEDESDVVPSPPVSAYKMNISESRHEGSLLLKGLPTDAWEEWCKDGVVCFRMFGFPKLKIYLANPRDLSVYHVVDFHYPRYGESEPFANFLRIGLALVGSKIYVLGSSHCDVRGGPLDVYYIDLANQNQPYEWMEGPHFKTCKQRPFLFSLAGNLYALSIGFAGSYYERFEVLKSGSNEWQVPSSPFSKNEERHVLGSFVVDDDKNKKILIHSAATGFHRVMLSIYDSKLEEWTTIPLDHDPSPNPNLSAKLSTIFSIEDIGFFLGRIELSFVLDTFKREFKTVVKQLLGDAQLWKMDYLYDQWHLLSLGRGRFCFLALYCDSDKRKSFVRFSTFDLVQDKKRSAASESDPKSKCLKLPGYKVENAKFKTINIVLGDFLLPAGGPYSKVEAFAEL